MNKKYNKQFLEEVVKKSKSVADVLRNLSLRPSGGNHAYLSKKIKEYQINTFHFSKEPHNKGKLSHKRKCAKQILVLKKSGNRERAFRLRRALIESNIAYKCNQCQINSIWNNKELRLEVDHINENFLDNRIENLQFLCPNCHSQTDTWCGKNK